jgi:putative flippase GtrA
MKKKNAANHKTLNKPIGRELIRKRFINFIIIGSFCSTFSLGCLYLLTTILNCHYMLSLTLTFIFGNFIGFCLNKYCNFRTQSFFFLEELWKYYSVMLSSFLVGLLLMFIMVDYLKIWYIHANFIVIVGSTIYNFLMHYKWSFK